MLYIEGNEDSSASFILHKTMKIDLTARKKIGVCIKDLRNVKILDFKCFFKVSAHVKGTL